ncbi:hypothetical protein [Tenacibaculum halocynthiae]|uniref:hypothetical protein n=1 Tax=Tenacibaculum halocynthiae TaxID=1254437 RepID=UPI0038944133
MTKQELKNTLLSSFSMTTGGMASRVIAEKLPIKNNHLKRGSLVLVGLLGASVLDRKSLGKSVVKDMALGTVVTQAGYWIKEALGENVKEGGLFKTALGSPSGDWDNPIHLGNQQFLSGYDFIPDQYVEDISFEPVEEFSA